MCSLPKYKTRNIWCKKHVLISYVHVHVLRKIFVAVISQGRNFIFTMTLSYDSSESFKTRNFYLKETYIIQQVYFIIFTTNKLSERLLKSFRVLLVMQKTQGPTTKQQAIMK